jgi:formyltetrahydrofolate deformylase
MRYFLNILCPDKKGIIAAVTTYISSKQANILDLLQHTAIDIDMFMLKAEFETDEQFDEKNFREDFIDLGNKFQMEWSLVLADKPVRAAILVSTTQHCLYELLLKHEDGELDCDLPVIISNHKKLAHVAKQFDVPFEWVDYSKGKKFAEAEIDRICRHYDTDILVLARFMQIISAELIDAWRNKIINIHHGFLPAFQGAKPYHQAWEKGVKIIGATAHFATEDLDQGPIIAQDVHHVPESCSIKEFIEKGKDIERRTLLTALRLYLSRSIFIHKNRTFILGKL